MGRLVQLLSGHERAVFTNGRFGFDLRPHALVVVACALLLVAFVYFVYLRPRARVRGGTHASLVALRASLLLLILFLLLKPVVVVPSVVPRSSTVALVADDSRSMQMADAGGGVTRLEAMRGALFAPDGPFLTRLRERFKTETYAFSSDLNSISGGEELSGEGAASDPGGAVAEAARRAAGSPLSAVVLVSDGAANVTTDLAAELRNLRARGLPVYTVGVGSARRPADAELVRVNLPRRVLVGSRDTPSGARLKAGSLTPSGDLLLTGREPGFYRLRYAAGHEFAAVNVDGGEGDFTKLNQEEFLAAFTGGDPTARRATAADERESGEEIESRQRLWWPLLTAALLLFIAESLLARRTKVAKMVG